MLCTWLLCINLWGCDLAALQSSSLRWLNWKQLLCLIDLIAAVRFSSCELPNLKLLNLSWNLRLPIIDGMVCTLPKAYLPDPHGTCNVFEGQTCIKIVDCPAGKQWKLHWQYTNYTPDTCADVQMCKHTASGMKTLIPIWGMLQSFSWLHALHEISNLPMAWTWSFDEWGYLLDWQMGKYKQTCLLIRRE